MVIDSFGEYVLQTEIKGNDGGGGDGVGVLVCVGVIAWFAFQTFENIGMTMGLVPMTGVPLPFMSYGGSSMFANLIGLGLIQNVHLRTR